MRLLSDIKIMKSLEKILLKVLINLPQVVILRILKKHDLPYQVDEVVIYEMLAKYEEIQISK
jgi:hypothetical protein